MQSVCCMQQECGARLTDRLDVLGLDSERNKHVRVFLGVGQRDPRVREDLLNLGTLDAHAVKFGVAPQVLFGCEVGAGGRERAVGEGRMSVGTHSAPEAHQRPSDASL